MLNNAVSTLHYVDYGMINQSTPLKYCDIRVGSKTKCNHFFGRLTNPGMGTKSMNEDYQL